MIVDYRIPCSVCLVCRERKLIWLKETALTGVAGLPPYEWQTQIAIRVPHDNPLDLEFKTGMCRSKPVRIICSKGSRFYFAMDYVYAFRKTMIAKHKKPFQESAVFHDEFVHACCSVLFNKV